MIFDSILRRHARARFAVLAAPAFLFAQPGHAAPAIADTFAHLNENRTVSRSVSLADLGIRDPLLLSAPDTRHEVYVPVPAGVPISDATLQIDGGYLRGDGGRTTMLVSLDGAPVLARGFAEPRGDAAASIGVDGAPRASGFVRVGLQWSSVIDDRLCTDQTAIGNVLRVAPSSRLNYRFDPANVADLRTAWSALPAAPVVAVAGQHVSAGVFDTAWRVETLIERDARTPVTRTLPAIGESVDLSGIDVPEALRSVPAFAALAAGGTHKVADAAELGALLVTAPPHAFAPDVVIADEALRRATGGALDALRAQIAAVSADGAAAFDAWRGRNVAALTTPLAAGEVRVAHLPGQAVIVVGDNTGVDALARAWRPIGVTDRLVVHHLDDARYAHADQVALAALGGEPRTLDVLGRAMWDASFDLAAVAADGKLPDDVVLDVAAAPTPHADGEIASVYFNGVLIASKLLTQDGKPQRITAHVPRYALAPTNLLRVMFQRRFDGGCEARAQGYPVAVLPTSHLTLAKATPDDDFTGMFARFASSANVIVPSAYLDDAPATLARFARLASAAGVSPSRAVLTVASGNAAVTPTGPFLAADVALTDEAGRAVLTQDRMTLTDADKRVFADVSGLSKLAVIQVAQAGGNSGVVYRSFGAAAPQLPPALRLTRGDIVLVSAGGGTNVFDSRHPGEVVTDERAFSRDAARRWPWFVAGGLVAALVLLIVVAGIVRRRHQGKGGA